MTRRAFSLVEVLVALTLILALFAALYGFFFDLLRQRERLNDAMARQRAAAMLIERLERDLQTCVAGGPRGESGIVGDNETLTIYARGVATQFALSDLERAFGDLQSTRYAFDPRARTFTLTRASAAAPRRRAAPDDLAGDSEDLEDLPPEDIDALTDSFELEPDAAEEATADESAPTRAVTGAEPLGDVRFRYHDGTRWRESFDSQDAGRLPAAVEVAIWYQPWQPEDEELDAMAAEDPAGFDTLDPDDPFAADRLDDPLSDDFLGEPDFGDEEPPPPDRFRVIAIPDAEAPGVGDLEITAVDAPEDAEAFTDDADGATGSGGSSP